MANEHIWQFNVSTAMTLCPPENFIFGNWQSLVKGQIKKSIKFSSIIIRPLHFRDYYSSSTLLLLSTLDAVQVESSPLSCVKVCSIPDVVCKFTVIL